jgi:hypothetical protein
MISSPSLYSNRLRSGSVLPLGFKFIATGIIALAGLGVLFKADLVKSVRAA